MSKVEMRASEEIPEGHTSSEDVANETGIELEVVQKVLSAAAGRTMALKIAGDVTNRLTNAVAESIYESITDSVDVGIALPAQIRALALTAGIHAKDGEFASIRARLLNELGHAFDHVAEVEKKKRAERKEFDTSFKSLLKTAMRNAGIRVEPNAPQPEAHPAPVEPATAEEPTDPVEPAPGS